MMPGLFSRNSAGLDTKVTKRAKVTKQIFLILVNFVWEPLRLPASAPIVV